MSKPSKPFAPSTVVSVDTKAKTITVKVGKQTDTFTVDGFTEVTINGLIKQLSDLKKGMTVSVATGSDQKKATRIDAGPGG